MIADLDNPEKFVRDPEAELFDEHEVRDEQGNLIRSVTKEDLEQYCLNNNERDKVGQPCAMTIGHTVDDEFDKDGNLTRRATEEEQPPVVGYWRQWRVKYSKDRGKWVACATPYIQKERYAEAKTYPRASVETWKQRKVIDPVAILRRTPDRPVQWTYSMPRWKPTETTGKRERYEMEDTEHGDKTAGVTEPTHEVSAKAPSEEEMEKTGAAIEHHFPKLKEMHEHYCMHGCHCGKHDMATASATNGSLPVGEPDESKEKFAATNRRIEALEAANKKLLAELATERQNRQAIERSTRDQIRTVELQKFAAVLDGPDEEKDILELTSEKYSAYLQRLERRQAHQADPANFGDFIPTNPPAGESKTYGAAEQAKANKYMKDNHKELQKIPLEQRIEKARKYAMTGSDK